MFQRCTTKVDGAIVTFSENKSHMRLLNPSRKQVSKIEVDGCMAINGDARCDWIALYDCEKRGSVAIFIELKGCRVDRAVEQLEATLRRYSDQFRRYIKECYVICTRSPAHNSEIRRIKMDFKKKYNASFVLKTVRYDLTIK